MRVAGKIRVGGLGRWGLAGLRGIWLWMVGSARGRRVPRGKRRGRGVNQDDSTIREWQDANTVDESDVEGAVESGH